VQLLAAEVAEYVPAAHEAHVDEPSTEYEPRLHAFRQLVDPMLDW
jgi:hypothetical protein